MRSSPHQSSNDSFSSLNSLSFRPLTTTVLVNRTLLTSTLTGPILMTLHRSILHYTPILSHRLTRRQTRSYFFARTPSPPRTSYANHYYEPYASFPDADQGTPLWSQSNRSADDSLPISYFSYANGACRRHSLYYLLWGVRIGQLPNNGLPVSGLVLRTIARRGRNSRLSKRGLTIRVRPLGFQPPHIRLPSNYLHILPFNRIMRLTRYLIRLAFFQRYPLLLTALSPPHSWSF